MVIIALTMFNHVLTTLQPVLGCCSSDSYRACVPTHPANYHGYIYVWLTPITPPSIVDGWYDYIQPFSALDINSNHYVYSYIYICICIYIYIYHHHIACATVSLFAIILSMLYLAKVSSWYHHYIYMLPSCYCNHEFLKAIGHIFGSKTNCYPQGYSLNIYIYRDR